MKMKMQEKKNYVNKKNKRSKNMMKMKMQEKKKRGNKKIMRS